MTKLKLGQFIDDKPIKISVEIPAAVHRDLVIYAELLGGDTRQGRNDPAKLIVPMIARFMETDREFLRAKRERNLHPSTKE